jgi:hypothetical protein
MMDMERIGRQIVLPCYSAMLEPDAVLLHDQYCSFEDEA